MKKLILLFAIVLGSLTIKAQCDTNYINYVLSDLVILDTTVANIHYVISFQGLNVSLDFKNVILYFNHKTDVNGLTITVDKPRQTKCNHAEFMLLMCYGIVSPDNVATIKAKVKQLYFE